MKNFLQLLKTIAPCIVCGSPEITRAPFCIDCLESLYPAPLTLCPVCMNSCKPEAHPFIQHPDSQRFQSIHAAFWLVGHSFEVAKAWKKKAGLFSNQVLFRWKAELIDRLKSQHFTHLVPMPQRIARIRQLHGNSPATQIAHSLSQQLNIEVLPLLQTTLANELHGKRQSQLSREYRSQVIDRFELNLKLLEKLNRRSLRILLIDDFATSGHTLRLATHQLKLAGVSQVHCFCLGIRPRLSACA